MADADLVWLARDGDAAAFRLLVERHRRAALARARWLYGDADEAEDIVQEAFLQAFVGIDRLVELDRFGAWLGGIVFNAYRAALRRRLPLTLLDEWPPELHPVTVTGLPEAVVDDLDRCTALGAAFDDLSDPQRAAAVLFYHADLPIQTIADRLTDSPAAVKARLHKARQRLREHITTHRPDLVPHPPWRSPMRTVRLAHVEPRPDKTHIHHVLVVLADDASDRALPIWLLGLDGHSLRLLHERRPGTGTAGVPEELTDRLLRAAGITVTGVDIDELGPEIPVARIGLHTPTGARQVVGRLADGLALALAYGAPIRVDEALLDRLGEPVPEGGLLAPFLDRRPQAATRTARRGSRPRNMAFTHGLDGWDLRGSFMRSPTAAHWQDYYCQATGERTAVLGAAVPQPYGFADLRQAVRADRYRSRTVRFRAELRAQDIGDEAGLYLRVVTEDTARDRVDQRTVATVSGAGWTWRDVSVGVPEDAVYVLFGITITGQGRIELRNADLILA